VPLAIIYSTGTASVTAGSTAVTARPPLVGRYFRATSSESVVLAFRSTSVGAGFDTITLAVPWPGSTQTNVAYLIDKRSTFRLTAASEFSEQGSQVRHRHCSPGLFLFVEGAAPDPALGARVYALKTNGGAWKAWVKTNGTWGTAARRPAPYGKVRGAVRPLTCE